MSQDSLLVNPMNLNKEYRWLNSSCGIWPTYRMQSFNENEIEGLSNLFYNMATFHLLSKAQLSSNIVCFFKLSGNL